MIICIADEKREATEIVLKKTLGEDGYKVYYTPLECFAEEEAAFRVVTYGKNITGFQEELIPDYIERMTEVFGLEEVSECLDCDRMDKYLSEAIEAVNKERGSQNE